MKYDQIGKTYNNTRVPDERITNRIISNLNLPLSSRVLDVGAGTGNYSYELAKADFIVTAIEPSETMRRQGKQHQNLEWLPGFAEQLPFDDQYFDGLICTLATHHFTNLELCFQEMARVVKKQGRIVIFSADPRICFNSCWITDYFREIVEQSCQSQPQLDEFVKLFEETTLRAATIDSFLLPYDLKDKFFFSGWRSPELYLDEVFRAGISSLASAPEEIVNENINRLKADLSTGSFHRAYGERLNRDEYDCGYFFLQG